jgi:bifunctional non-homologous end joining protein LigD
MQLLARLPGEQTAEQVTGYARQVANDLATALPDLVTAQMAKNLRPGKVFFDWSQNAGAKTTVSPYSLRAAPTPTVSAPVAWRDVEHGRVSPVEADAMLAHLERHGDPLAALLPP